MLESESFRHHLISCLLLPEQETSLLMWKGWLVSQQWPVSPVVNNGTRAAGHTKKLHHLQAFYLRYMLCKINFISVAYLQILYICDRLISADKIGKTINWSGSTKQYYCYWWKNLLVTCSSACDCILASVSIVTESWAHVPVNLHISLFKHVCPFNARGCPG